MKKDSGFKFPKNFFWGASTSSHQVEGGNHNQWSIWELSHAASLASSARSKHNWMPIWDEVRDQAERPQNYVSGRGVDHYRLYKQDFKLLGKLNLNSFRFGVEWSRLEPEEGVWDNTEWQHYKDYINSLKRHGIEPFMNVWHWTVPVWFEEKGGFKHRKNLKFFKRFVEKLAYELGGQVKYVFTINEPNVFASLSYFTGEWPPQEKNPWSFIKVYYNLTIAHKYCYNAFKKRNKRVQIGVATQMGNIQARRKHNVADQVMVKWMRYVWNWWFVNRIRRYQDFVGFNYYFTDYYRGLKSDNPKAPVNDLGWYMEPEGLYPLLLCVHKRYKLPIYITESGVADKDDKYRRWWIEESIVAMERAISGGVDVRGYFHWSLLDNFEWAYGWWPRFGLVEVDRTTMQRKIRPSANWYADKIKQL